MLDNVSPAGDEQKKNFFARAFLKLLKNKKGLGVVCIVAGIILAAILIRNSDIKNRIWPEGGQQFGQTYKLVAEKISKSASIVIHLPVNTEASSIQAGTSFAPAIEGSWLASDSPAELIFQPAQPLEAGKYYTITVNTSGFQSSSDFFVDEDPKVSAIFPAAGSETHENSNITIVFNRPMVPLTTLDILEDKDVPVTIDPATEGKWKWVSTRNLQFIPKEHLRRSSKYHVRIREGFISVDGLSLARAPEYSFSTRPLRYQMFSSGRTIYNQPISIIFNQPVDLDATIPSIVVTNAITGKKIDFVATYGKRKIHNEIKDKDEIVTDRSIIDIFQKRDRHGRKELWDFDSSYMLSIKTATPFEGDINLVESRSTTVQVPAIIESLTARSERSEHVRLDLFDPAGTLEVLFYEPIDLNRSKINAPGLADIRYGRVCKEDEEGSTIYLGSGECEKEEDRKILVLAFSPSRLTQSQTIPVEFRKIFNESGLQINVEVITENLKTYPQLKILRTAPAEGASAGNLTSMYVCTNTPLARKDDEDETKGSRVTSGIVNNTWGYSYYIEQTNSYSKCKKGEFETSVQYGLLPLTKYILGIHFEDQFGQTVDQSISFISGDVEAHDVRISNLQKVYNVTQPGKTRLTYTAENIDYVTVHICKMKPEVLLESITTRPEYTTPPSDSRCSATKTDKIELPKKFWTNNYFQVDIGKYFPDSLGHYVVTVTHPKFRETYGNYKQMYDRTYVTVTRLAVGEKRVAWGDAYYYYDEYDGRNGSSEENNIPEELTNPGENLYWVTSFGSLAPVHNASVALYTKSTNTRQGGVATFAYGSTHLTDASGIAHAKILKNITGAVVSYGKDSALVSEETDTLLYTSNAHEARRTYVYTDRPIYRQGQEVFIKGIDRIGYDGSYEILKNRDAVVEVINSEEESVYKQSLPMSENGTFDARFVIPTDAPLGAYRILAFNTEHTFDVEAYVPAAFKLELAPERDEYIAGERLVVTVDADYYFGVPVDGGEVEYSVTSQDYYFDKFKDEYFNFGADWYECYDCGYGDAYLFRGKTKLTKEGTGRIEELLDFNEYYSHADEEGSKIFTLHVTVRDSSGRSVSGQRSIVVHRGEIYLGVKSDKSFLPKGEEFMLRAKSVTIKGEPIGKSNIMLTINRIVWNTFKRKEVDGGFYYRSEKTTERIEEREIQTNGNGDWSEAFSMAEEGEYEVRLTHKDRLGNTVQALSSVYVYGSGQVDVRETNDYSLDVATEKKEVSPGDRPVIVIKSPYAHAKALITVDRGKVFDYWVVDVDRSFYDHVIPIKKEYGPNVFVSVLLISPDPEIKFGQVEFTVDSKHRELDVEVTSDKAAYLPGEKVKLSIVTKNYLGVPVPAEVSIAVADLSVLALKGNPKKNPFVFFYNGFPLTVKTSSNIKNVLYEKEIPVGTKGGGSGDPEDLARRKRGEFKDTAFWSAKIMTDAGGKADLSFTLPDNLTTWQIESLGITKDTLVGVDYDEFTARKDLMVVPLAPRFIVPGDEFYIGVKIFNQTSRTQKLTTSIESSSLEFLEEVDVSVSIPSGKTETKYFKVRAPANIQKGVHKFTLGSKSDLYEDVVEKSISITPNDTYESVATANFTKADSASEYVHIPSNVVGDKGGLVINTNATMAVFLSGALNYLVEYPYGCSEQLASKLSSIAVVKRGLNVKNVGDAFKLENIEFEGDSYTVDEVVTIALARIYENQNGNGSFSYYKTLSPSFHLTLHILGTLVELRKAGFAVREDSITRAASYLTEALHNDVKLQKDKDLVIVTAYTLTNIPGVQMGDLMNQVDRIAKNSKFVQEDISSVSLSYLSVLTSRGYAKSSKERILTALENRIDIDGRGAYMKSAHNNVMLDFYETPIKNTALLLKALVASKKDHPLTDKIIRWLLRSRSKDGSWGSTNNTLTVIDGMVDFLDRERETESEFELTATLREKELFTFDFNKQNILSTQSHGVPISEFAVDTTEKLDFTRANKNSLQNNFYYDMLLKYYLPIEQILPRDEGITLTRELFTLADEKSERPIQEAAVGEVVRGKITLTTPDAYNFVAIEDFIPAGFELVNFKLSTEDQSLKPKNEWQDEYGYECEDCIGMQPAPLDYVRVQEKAGGLRTILKFFTGIFGGNRESDQISQVSRTRAIGGVAYYDEPTEKVKRLPTDFEETHDDRVFLFTEKLAPGVYEYEYYLHALVPGTFHHLPAVASQMYFPEVFGRTAGEYFKITQE